MKAWRGYLRTVLSAGFVLLGWSASAMATNGHFLHGVGAINSSMGGAAIGQAEDTLGALVRAQSIGDVLGTALAFAGLASLAVGLTHAVGLFRAAEETAPVPKAAEKQA